MHQRLQQIPIISLHLSTIQGASKNAGKLPGLLKENCKRIADSGHSIAGLDYNGSKSLAIPSSSLSLSIYSCGFSFGVALGATNSLGAKESWWQMPAISVLGNMATAGDGSNSGSKHGMTKTRPARPLWGSQDLQVWPNPLIFKCQVYSGPISHVLTGSPEVDQLPPSRSVVDEPLQRWILTKAVLGEISNI